MRTSAATAFLAMLALAVFASSAIKAETLTGAAAKAEAEAAAGRLAAVQTLIADFDVLNERGLNQGRIYVDRQREAIRVEFDPPLNHLVLVNGPRIQFFGGDGTEIETGAAGTPFAFLMDPEAALRDSVEVLQVQKDASRVVIALAERGNTEKGQLILTFEGSGAWRLRQWGMFDDEGRYSQTKLTKVTTNAAIDGGLFRAPERAQRPD